jgi:hypothetical protein
LCPNILLTTQLSNNLNLCSYHSVRDEVSHPYTHTCCLYVCYFELHCNYHNILVFIYADKWKIIHFSILSHQNSCCNTISIVKAEKGWNF